MSGLRPLPQKQRGFTIVELLIVIVVIGILAAITIVAYNGIQLRARDADRASDISTLKKKLDIYYASNGSYPSAYDMSSSTFRRNSLDIQSDGTVTPSGSSQAIYYCWPGNTNSYCYSGTTSGDCVSVGAACTGYWIIYRTESNPTADILITK